MEKEARGSMCGRSWVIGGWGGGWEVGVCWGWECRMWWRVEGTQRDRNRRGWVQVWVGMGDGVEAPGVVNALATFFASVMGIKYLWY